MKTYKLTEYKIRSLPQNALKASKNIDQPSHDAIQNFITINSSSPNLERDSIRFTSERICSQCSKCLSPNKPPMGIPPVLGKGNVEAKLMLVGEAPGEWEILKKEPFIGPAGQELNQALKFHKLDRDKDLYISNAIKCRPTRYSEFDSTKLVGRKPSGDELANCKSFISAEIEIVSPEVIILLGQSAYEQVTSQPIGSHFTPLVGSEDLLNYKSWDGTDRSAILLTTWHPSYILRKETKKEQNEIRKDIDKTIKRAKEILGI